LEPTEQRALSTEAPGRLRRFLSEAGLAARLIPWYLKAVRKGIGFGDTFDRIEQYCMFIGYSRSGHTLVGSLLNAHPEIVIAHELDAVKYFMAGYGRKRIFSLILDNSSDFASRGSEWSGYSYAVPDQWQGRYENLRIIGDKRGGRTTRRFMRQPWMVHIIEKRLSLPVRYIHVLRNPYDVISSMHRYGGGDIQNHINRFFKSYQTNEGVKRAVGEEQVFDLRLEDLINEPIDRLSDLCRFLGVEASGDYLEACAEIVMDTPSKSRLKFEWTPEQVEHVRQRIETCPMLEGYSFTD